MKTKPPTRRRDREPSRRPPPAAIPEPEPPHRPKSDDSDGWIDYMSEESFPASDPPGHGHVTEGAGEPDQGGGER